MDKPLFRRQHYIFIAEVLRAGGDVASFVKALQQDNPHFNPDKFIKAIEYDYHRTAGKA